MNRFYFYTGDDALKLYVETSPGYLVLVMRFICWSEALQLVNTGFSWSIRTNARPVSRVQNEHR